MEDKSSSDLKKQLKVQFIGEEGVDEGGLQKEFFQLFIREMLQDKYGMFNFNSPSRLCWFVSCNDEPSVLIEYKLVGLVLGLALYNSVILDLYFPSCLYKKLLGIDTCFQDLKDLDPQLYQSLLNIIDQIDEITDLTFQITYESLGEPVIYNLVPEGDDILVTMANVHGKFSFILDFVELYSDFVLNQHTLKEFEAFKEGFDLVCNNSSISMFLPEELELVICGETMLNFADLKRNTNYDGYTSDSQIIQ